MFAKKWQISFMTVGRKLYLKSQSQNTSYGLEKGPIENPIFITSGNQGMWKRRPTLISEHFRPCLKAFSKHRRPKYFILCRKNAILGELLCFPKHELLNTNMDI